jgi:hypothetical protein
MTSLLRRLGITLAPLTLVLMCLATPALSGIWHVQRNSCKVFVRYKITVSIRNQDDPEHPCASSDQGCTYAEAQIYNIGTGASDCSTTYPGQFACTAKCKQRFGVGHYLPETWTSTNRLSCGNAFVALSSPGTVLGTARGGIDAIADFVPGPGSETTILLHDFAGSISAKTNSMFGSSFRCIVWNGLTPTDSILTPAKALWDGGIRIESGQPVALGSLALSDFVISDGVDGDTGDPVIQLTPIAGLTKSVIVNDDDSNNTIAVTMTDDAGYGTYDANSIYDTIPTTLPILNRVGAVLMAVSLTALGIAALSRGRRAAA